MSEYPLSYREVIPDQVASEIWTEISLNTGGTRSILQDIKLVDKANGYCYKDSSQHFTRNRFIYWRISNNTLELIEHSLDINLAGNRVRYKFIDTPLLDGVSIHETLDNVIVLVPTVCSVHRLVYPHPRNFHKSDDLLGIHSLSARSIFANANDAETGKTSTYYIFTGPNSANSQLPILASSTLHLVDGRAIFILIYPSGEILLVQHGVDGQNYCAELKHDSIVPRFLSGLAEKLRSKLSDDENVVSLVLHSVGLETFAITLTRDAQLKFWSCTKVNCAAVHNITTGEIGDYASNALSTQNNVIRKAADGENENVLFAIFLTNQNQFHVIKPIFEPNQIRLVRLHSLYAPENDLIDLSLTMSRIWSVWRSIDGDCKVYSTCLQEDARDWIPVILEEPPESQPPDLDSDADPSQIYLQYIFHPGRFPLNVINKALNTHQGTMSDSDLNIPPGILKRRICMAIYKDIQSKLKEGDVSYDEYLQCASWSWQRFYSNCEQYNTAGLKPLGILLLPGVSGAVLLKKSTFSFLRPLDTLEYMLLCSEHMSGYQFLQQGGLSEDTNLIPDVIDLMEVVVYLNGQMSEAFGRIFEQELAQLCSPDIVMSEMLDKIQLEMDSEFSSRVSSMLNDCRDLYQAIHKLMELLRDSHRTIEDDDKKCDNSLAYLFTSQLGVSVVTQSLHQQAETRFIICRNLLLIVNILLKRQELPWEVLEAVRSVCSPEIVVLTQASYAIYWLSGLPALPAVSDEIIKKRLAPLKLTPVFNARNSHLQVTSVLGLFIGSKGGHIGHNKFAQLNNIEGIQHWHNSLLPYLSHLFQIVWPISGCPVLAEWLLSSGQHVWLQQYVRLLKNWCEWNNCTRSFLLACSFLLTGENHKARELFGYAVRGVLTDPFLSQRILKNLSKDAIMDGSLVNATYYLKIIQLFELNNADDYVVDLANVALCTVSPDQPVAATLYSIKFKHYLKLKHYEYAFDALYANPDEQRKMDSLRDLVKCLVDADEFDTLLSFNYGELEELFIEILTSRARAIDSAENKFYDLLYAYHVKRGPAHFYLAGTAMYEHAYRLDYKKPNLKIVTRQYHCFLAALNILRLCDKKKVEILIPKQPVDEKTSEPQIDSVDIDDIKNEYEFARAKLKLVKRRPEVALMGPPEVVLALAQDHYYSDALRLCECLEFPYEKIFEMLTEHCIAMTKARHQNINLWNWLYLNEIQDIIGSDKPRDIAWRFVEKMMNKYEEPRLSSLHKAIAKTILEKKRWIPHWLWASYKVRNAAELLRLLYVNGRFKLAIEIASGFMLAMMGNRFEEYGLETSLSPTCLPLWCPTLLIKTLVAQLEAQAKLNNEKWEKDYIFLRDLYDRYIETAVRISDEACKYRLELYNNAVGQNK